MTTTSISLPASTSKGALWTGRVISGLTIAFMIVDAVMKIILHPLYVKGTMDFGFPQSSVMPIGLILLAFTILYIIPRTAFLGAIFLTAYMGAATVSVWRIGQPAWFSVVFCILIWAGLYLRDVRLRAAIPIVKG